MRADLNSTSRILIIGNGIAGITAARHIRRLSDCHISVISSESPWFFSRTAMMYVYMKLMNWEQIMPYEKGFWKKNRIDLILAHVDQIEPDARRIALSDGTKLNYDRLILATGSVYKTLGCPGENLGGVQGLYHVHDLELLEKNTSGQIRRAIIAGGGLIGVEMAEMLRSRGITVDFVIREKGFWGNVLPEEESALVGRHLISQGVRLHLGRQLREIVGNDSGRVKGVILDSGEELDGDFVGITIGVSPNTGLARSSGLDCRTGVRVNAFLETNKPDIYAIGDCAELIDPPAGYRAIEPTWYVGRMMGETVAATICGNRRVYEPGPWFNSAKFFDLEYQVYGHVPVKPSDRESSVYWEDPKGARCLRITFDKTTSVIIGVHAIGIRLRKEVAVNWIESRKTMSMVSSQLRELNFNEEFSPDWTRFTGEAITRWEGRN